MAAMATQWDGLFNFVERDNWGEQLILIDLPASKNPNPNFYFQPEPSIKMMSKMIFFQKKLSSYEPEIDDASIRLALSCSTIKSPFLLSSRIATNF